MLAIQAAAGKAVAFDGWAFARITQL